MEKRLLGSTGERISIIGFGGMLLVNENPSTAKRLIDNAINRGIDYFDVAPFYENAEELLGKFIKPYRSKIFLSTKTLKRDKKGSKKELYNSLKKLHSDHIDLYLLHRVTYPYEVNQIMGPNGAMETFIEAREKGIVRYLGFSTHSESTALHLLDNFDFDCVLFPLNWVCWYQGMFGPELIKKASNRKIGIIAIKSLVKRKLKKDEKTKWPKCWYLPVENFTEASLALRFTLGIPVTSVISPSHSDLLWLSCDVADKYKPLSNSEIKKIKEKSKILEPILSNGIISF